VNTPQFEGRVDPRFERVREAFVANFREHDELGASVAVLLHGRPVVDLWGGFADRERTRPWNEDTLVNVFSVGKAIVTLALLMLVDRGLVDLDSPVARYWPEFAAADKETITVRQLLAHRAGLPAVREILPERAMLDWTRMTEALAGQSPWWTPGTTHGYHVNTFGFLVGEIVRRVSGLGVGAFVRKEIAGPAGADFHIGLAAEHDARVAEFVWLPELDLPALPEPSDPTPELLLFLRTYANPYGASGHGGIVNTPAWRRAEYPSTNTHATAMGIARVYEVVAGRGILRGQRRLGADLLAEAAREHSSGVDFVLGKPSRFGLGFQLAPLAKPIGPNDGVLLHFGAGGALGFADPEAGIAFGYAMNRMGLRQGNPTNRALIGALYESLASG
jgi:CubicO group peptidase (beta-lactamase class C family)